MSDDITLNFGTALAHQKQAFGFGLDAFRKHRDVERFAKADDGAHDRLRLTVVIDAQTKARSILILSKGNDCSDDRDA